MRKLLLRLAVGGLAFICARAYGIELPTSVELLAPAPRDAASPEMELALRFKIATGWHVYYREPGEAGRPTRVNFILPPELEAGEILWPEPEKFVLPGNKRCNGYSSEFQLKTRVRRKAQLAQGQQLIIKAEVSWLNCKEEMCVPQKQRLEQVLIVGS